MEEVIVKIHPIRFCSCGNCMKSISSTAMANFRAFVCRGCGAFDLEEINAMEVAVRHINQVLGNKGFIIEEESNNE